MGAFFERTGPIGLDVGTRAIKAVQFAGTGGSPKLTAAACIERTGEGPVLTASEAAGLRAVLSRQGFRGRGVVIAGAESQLLSAVMELPPRSSGAPLDQIARVELARANNCAPDSIEMAWWELPAGSRAQEGTHVFAIGLRQSDADAAIDGLEAAGFDVQKVDSPILAIGRMCAQLGAIRTSQVTGLLDLGWQSATIAVLLDQTLVYQRLLTESGLAALHARLMKDLKIEPEAAEFVIRKVGVQQDLPAEQQEWELLGDARAIVSDHFETLGKELRASMSYALRRYAATGSAGVVVCGGGALVPGMVDRLQSQIEERVCPLRPGDLGPLPADPFAAKLAVDPRLACAAGLALEITPAAAPQGVPA